MNLFIGNLHPDTVASSLRPLFSEFGEVLSVKILIDNATGASRCFGFVEMADKFQAFDAIDNIDATFFEGNVISVKEAKQNTTKTPGNRGGGMNKPFKPRVPRPGGYNNYTKSGTGNSYNKNPGDSYNTNMNTGGDNASNNGAGNDDTDIDPFNKL